MKLEDNFKEKLEGRRIAPTASAWDRIEGKLEVAQDKKKSNVVLWMAIAASFVAGMVIMTFVFSGDPRSLENEIVTIPNPSDTLKEMKVSEEQLRRDEITQTVDLVNNEATTPVEIIVDKQPLSRKRTTKANNSATTASSYMSIYKTKAQRPFQNKSTGAIVITNKSRDYSEKRIDIKILDNSRITEVVAALEETKVTDAEIDKLLENARKELKRKRIYSPGATVVDANELLLDAEAEVDPDSFKDRIFKTLKKEFDKAVEAVANKDN